MALQVKRIGFGQVEPNHLSAQTNGQIYAQLPADPDFDILENGMFLKYNYADGVCDLDTDGEWLLVMNEIKLYDSRKQGLKDYAMKKVDFLNGEMVPRLLRTEIGDIFTTNTLRNNNVLISLEKTKIQQKNGLAKFFYNRFANLSQFWVNAGAILTLRIFYAYQS